MEANSNTFFIRSTLSRLMANNTVQKNSFGNMAVILKTTSFPSIWTNKSLAIFHLSRLFHVAPHYATLNFGGIYNLQNHDIGTSFKMTYFPIVQISVNAWLWSTVFHTRDLLWTEVRFSSYMI